MDGGVGQVSRPEPLPQNESALLPLLASRLVGPQNCSESSDRIFYFPIDQLVDIKIQREIMKFNLPMKLAVRYVEKYGHAGLKAVLY